MRVRRNVQVDDESDLRGDGSPRTPRTRLTLGELFDEDRLEVMSCRYADYDPARLGGGSDSGGSGGGMGWLEEYPNPSLSPKAVSKRESSSSSNVGYRLFSRVCLYVVLFGIVMNWAEDCGQGVLPVLAPGHLRVTDRGVILTGMWGAGYKRELSSELISWKT